MALSVKNRIIAPLVAVTCALVAWAGGLESASAQSLIAPFKSVVPLTGIERFIGPIFPQGGIAGTFRSELTCGYHGAVIETSRLGGPLQQPDLDLRGHAPFDQYPGRFTIKANVRLWRFGLRAGYSHFETLGHGSFAGSFDFSGLNVGLDVDLVQFQHLAIGVAADRYFYEPSLIARDLQVDPGGTIELINVDGEKPATAGPYVRYVPPEILGFPVHFEAFYNVPLHGSKLLNYGVAFVFRPQIYRFDLGARFSLEKLHLSFEDDPDEILFGFASPGENWEVDMEWQFYGLEMIVFF